jgi:hypothetical protein
VDLLFVSKQKPRQHEQGGAEQTKAPRYEVRRWRCHSSSRRFLDHLKLHDKYLFDAKTRQIVAALGDPK